MIAITRVEDTDRLAAGLELFEWVLPGSMRRNGRDHRHFSRLLRNGSGVVVIAEDRDGPIGVFLGSPREDRTLYYDAVVAPGVDAPPVIDDLVGAGARHAAAAGYAQLMSHEPVDGAHLYESLGHVPTMRIQFNGTSRVERRREMVQRLNDHRVLALNSADDWLDASFRIDRVDTALQEQLSAPNQYVMHMMHRWAGVDRPRQIATSYPRFRKHANTELRLIDPDLEVAEVLDAGTTQVRSGRPGHDIHSALAAEPAVFVHHAAPIAEEIPLAGDWADVATIAAAVQGMRLPSEFNYAAECRKGRHTVAGPHTEAAYTTRDVEIAVGTQLAADARSIELEHPDRIISIYLAGSNALIGVHTGEFADRMRRTPTTVVSRAEHKPAEALELFDIAVEPGQRALDLGAAPGGWSYLLAERGMTVTAVDPGELAPAVDAHPSITHVRARAEDLQSPAGSFALAVNDMNMDPDDSARVMCSVAGLLTPQAHAILTIKLPGRADRGIAAATAVLESAYDIVSIRHLPHNRQEVTALLRPRGVCRRLPQEIHGGSQT